MQIHDATFINLLNQPYVFIFMIARFNIVKRAKWRDANAHMIGIPCVDARINHLKGQSRPVFFTTPVFIGALIGMLDPKLMQQITMSTMNLDTIKSSFARVFGSVSEISNHLIDFIKGSRSWRGRIDTDGLVVAVAQRGANPDVNVRCGDGRTVIRLNAFMRHQSRVPKLQDNFAAFSMDIIDNHFPCRHLIIGMNTRCARVTFGLKRHLRGFRDNQASGGSLRIILSCQCCRNITRLNGAQSG